MNEEREMVLRMLKEGKISVEEADALLQELADRAPDSPTAAEQPPRPAEGPDLRSELRGVFNELMASIPKDVLKEIRRTKDVLRPGFFQVLRGLHGLEEGHAESAAEEPMTFGETLVVRNAWGDVRLSPSSDGRLRVKADKRVWGLTIEEASRAAETLSVGPRRQGSEVVIGAPPMEGQRFRVDFELSVPSGVGVTLDMAKGDVQASGLEGHIRGRVARGDVQVMEQSGAVDLSIGSGDVTLKHIAGGAAIDVKSGDVSVAQIEDGFQGRVLRGDVEIRDCADVSVHGMSGDLSVADATGEVVVDTKSGDIDLRDLRASAVRARTLSGDVSLSLAAIGETGAITAETLSGDITLALPPDARAVIDAAVASGEVSCALPLVERTGDRRSLRGVLNARGATVTLRATSGDIDIRGIR